MPVWDICYISYTVCIKKRLVFEIQINHNVLNLPMTSIIAWNHLASRKQKIFHLWDMTD